MPDNQMMESYMPPYFNEDNTERYSSDELELLNEVFEDLKEELLAGSSLEEDFREDYVIHIGDALHNTWVEGIEYDELFERARARLKGAPGPIGR
jgi:hypothetical protein